MKTRKNEDGTSHVLDDHGRVIGHFGDHKSAQQFAGEATEENNEVVHEQELKEEKDMRAHDKAEKGHAQHLEQEAEEPAKRSHHKKPSSA
jgi:hypothetical protein